MTKTLPVIDLSAWGERRSDSLPLLQPASAPPAATSASSMSSIMASSSELMNEAFAQSQRFFALPLADKERSRSKQSAATAAIPGSCTRRSTQAQGPT